MRKVEIENVEAMVEKPIDKIGRITGLKQWEGRKAIIVISKE